MDKNGSIKWTDYYQVQNGSIKWTGYYQVQNGSIKWTDYYQVPGESGNMAFSQCGTDKD